MKQRNWIIFGGLVVCVIVGAFVFRSRLFHVSPETVISQPDAMQEAPVDSVAENQESLVLQDEAQKTEAVTPDEQRETAVAADDSIKEETTSTKAEPVKIQEQQETKQTEEKKASKTSSSLTIKDKFVNFGFSVPSKPRTIDTIILHSSYNSLGDDPYSVNAIVDIYKSYGVSAHYIIGRDGMVYRLVKEENVSYHAGVSKVPDGRTNVNDFSIGIEIVNTKDGKYTDEQYTAVKQLIKAIKGRYSIKYVLGHDDIAPGRKTDPWNFDWKKL